MPKVLVVEDDSDIRKNMKSFLEMEGYMLKQQRMSNCFRFLAKVADLPSLIILDLTMPIMDGFQFREKQIADQRLKQIPVMIMTADGRIEEKKKITNAQAALKKPADIDVIIKTVKQFC